MVHSGTGRRTSRSMYGKLFNVAQDQAGFESQHSLDPIVPAAKREYTVQSFTSPQEPFINYEKVDLGDIPIPNHAQTFGRSLEGPKEAIRMGFWHNSYKLLPHLAASAVTVAVVQLSFRKQYWVRRTPYSQTTQEDEDRIWIDLFIDGPQGPECRNPIRNHSGRRIKCPPIGSQTSRAYPGSFPGQYCHALCPKSPRWPAWNSPRYARQRFLGWLGGLPADQSILVVNHDGQGSLLEILAPLSPGHPTCDPGWAVFCHCRDSFTELVPHPGTFRKPTAAFLCLQPKYSTMAR
jgi:hypothetical protein